ncbi:hypothetical protein NPIL_434011 [Nephila pilipes]|uniref:Uncharacterized protein n=1 Tax=Nephila pilipes TaxID=299642 RepID=A0A8X6PDP3_NEPPI|nr:hypothetical protein NPIL_434011 [Nephila pilipes]
MVLDSFTGGFVDLSFSQPLKNTHVAMTNASSILRSGKNPSLGVMDLTGEGKPVQMLSPASLFVSNYSLESNTDIPKN